MASLHKESMQQKGHKHLYCQLPIDSLFQPVHVLVSKSSNTTSSFIHVHTCTYTETHTGAYPSCVMNGTRNECVFVHVFVCMLCLYIHPV